MTLLSFLTYLPAMLVGSLVIHLVWPNRRPMALLFKMSLGIGLGLGMGSMLYFAILLVAPNRVNMVLLQVLLAGALAAVIFMRDRGPGWNIFRVPAFSALQWALLAAAGIALIFLGLTFVSLSVSRPQGAFDAWSIWDRAARFIYRDPENWQATLSPELYWGSHPDYPLLVPLNVAWAWQALGTETQRVPMMQGGLLTLASIGVMFASVGLTRTIGQAGLAALVLMGTPILVLMGAAMIADVPLTFFILASSVLVFIALVEQSPGLLASAGFMAGLAGWTKNEGLLFIVISPVALVLFQRKSSWRFILYYAAGLVIPLALILYFKSIAASSDLFADGGSGILHKIMDPSRYWIILKTFGEKGLSFGGWPFSILVGLSLYALIMRGETPPGSRQAGLTVGGIILLQLLGYGAIYVLTPHDLEWHLVTSLTRLILHIFPTIVFLVFSMIITPEQVFQGALPFKESR
jgi:hypothetical protein